MGYLLQLAGSASCVIRPVIRICCLVRVPLLADGAEPDAVHLGHVVRGVVGGELGVVPGHVALAFVVVLALEICKHHSLGHPLAHFATFKITVIATEAKSSGRSIGVSRYVLRIHSARSSFVQMHLFEQ